VRSGSGITILPAIAAHSEISAGTLSAVSLNHEALVLKEFVRSGSGITILPAIAAHSEISAGTLSAVSLNHEALMQTKVSVITRLGRELPLAAVKLLQQLEAIMPNLPVS